MCEGDWEGKVWAGRACSPPHPHLHIQVSSGIQQHLHHRLVPTDAGVHQGGHALRWLKPEMETFTRWPWSVDKHMERLTGGALRPWQDRRGHVEPCDAQGHSLPGKGSDITLQHPSLLKLEGFPEFHGTADLSVSLTQAADCNGGWCGGEGAHKNFLDPAISTLSYFITMNTVLHNRTKCLVGLYGPWVRQSQG